MAVTWNGNGNGNGEGLGATWMLRDAILGSPRWGWGCAEGTLRSRGDTWRWQQPLGCPPALPSFLPMGRPQALRFHLLFLGISAETLKPCIPMEAPSNLTPSISLLPGAPPAPEPGTAPLVPPPQSPWSPLLPPGSPSPSATLDPTLGTPALGVLRLSPFTPGRVVLPPYNPSSLPPPFSPLSPLSQARREGERF